jgi:hypothetical protein
MFIMPYDIGRKQEVWLILLLLYLNDILGDYHMGGGDRISHNI